MDIKIRDIKNYLEPITKKTPTCYPEDSLDRALSRTTSSHESVLVLDENKNMIGIVSPYLALFKSRLPFTAQVKSAMIKPPNITPNTLLTKVAELMLAHRTISFPIFEGENANYLITADGIMKFILDSDLIGVIGKYIKIQKPVIVQTTTTAKKVYQIMKNENASRVLLVNKYGTLKGIVTRKDIFPYLTKPTTKQRVKTGGTSKSPNARNAKSSMFSFELTGRLEFPISAIAKSPLHIHEKEPIEKIIERLLTSDYKSIVLTDEQEKPTGIISIRNVIEALTQLKPEEVIKIDIRNQAEIPEQDIDFIFNKLQAIAKSLNKMNSVKDIFLRIVKDRNAAGRAQFFEMSCSIRFFSGDEIFAKITTRNYKRDLTQLKEKIRKEAEKKFKK